MQISESLNHRFHDPSVNLKFEIVRLRIKKWERLRIRQKDIDVMTFAMIDLEHHRSAATEGPVIDDDLWRVDLSDKRARHPE